VRIINTIQTFGRNSDTMHIATPGIVKIPDDEIDQRSDQELIAYLQNPPPVTHERNLWAFWDCGFQKMYPWCQRNILGWMRRQGPSWDVRVLDMVPDSPSNASNFIPPEYLPQCFRDNTMDGFTKGQHASDLARLPLLYLHGGVWLDVGSILFRNLEDIFWRDLEDPESPLEMGITLFQSRKYIGQCQTGFIGARKGNPFMYRWMRVWQEVWDDRTNCMGLHKHPLLQHLGTILMPEMLNLENPRKLDFGGEGVYDLALFTDYVALNQAYERVRLLRDDAGGWDGPAYFRKHVHLLDAIDELWKSHEMLSQGDLYPLLSLPFKAEDVDSDPKQKAASEYVGYVLANCSIAKHSQGHWQPGTPMPLAKSWSLPENDGADIRKGTWAEYLRWASVSCKQTRRVGQCLESLKLPEEQDTVLHAGLLEAKE
jgi:hypothetical protein